MTSKRSYSWKSAQAEGSMSYIEPVAHQLIEKSPQRILDIGCGNGYFAGQLQKQGHDVLGIDDSESGISLAVQNNPGCRFKKKSVYEIDRSIGQFDTVVSLEVIEHLIDPEQMLENIFRVLKPGGKLILSTPYHGYLKNLLISITNGWDNHFCVSEYGWHIKFFSKRTLLNMLEKKGFVVEEFVGVGRAPFIWKSMIVKCTKRKLSRLK